jgi:hypothetical protein
MGDFREIFHSIRRGGFGAPIAPRYTFWPMRMENQERR